MISVENERGVPIPKNGNEGIIRGKISLEEADEKVSSRVKETLEKLDLIVTELKKNGMTLKISEGFGMLYMDGGKRELYRDSIDVITKDPSRLFKKAQERIDKRNEDILYLAFLRGISVVDDSIEEKKEEKKEKIEVEEHDEKIRKTKAGIDLSQKTGLKLQEKNYLERLGLLEKERPAVVLGYSKIKWHDEVHMKFYEIGTYPGIIPRNAMYDYAKTRDLFDGYEIWIEYDNDPILVGRFVFEGIGSYYKMASW